MGIGLGRISEAFKNSFVGAESADGVIVMQVLELANDLPLTSVHVVQHPVHSITDDTGL